MKNLFRAVFAAVMCALVFGATLPVQASDAAYVRELYKKMSENQRTLKSLKVKILMENYNPQTKETDKRQGSLMYLPTGARDANIKLEWTFPENEILSVVDGKYKLFRPRLNQFYEGKTKETAKTQDDVNNVLGFVTMSEAELRQKFNAKWLDPELIANGSISAYHLKLTPKTDAKYKEIEIWVMDDGMPVQAKAQMKNGDVTTVLLHEVQKNSKFTKKDLGVKIPSNAQKLKV